MGSGGNQYAQLVDNGSASGNNSCQGEQAPTVGQKNGGLIRQKKSTFIKSWPFLLLEKIDTMIQGMVEKENLGDDIFREHGCTT